MRLLSAKAVAVQRWTLPFLILGAPVGQFAVMDDYCWQAGATAPSGRSRILGSASTWPCRTPTAGCGTGICSGQDRTRRQLRVLFGYTEPASRAVCDWLPLIHSDDIEITCHQLIVHPARRVRSFPETQFRVAHKSATGADVQAGLRNPRADLPRTRMVGTYHDVNAGWAPAS